MDNDNLGSLAALWNIGKIENYNADIEVEEWLEDYEDIMVPLNDDGDGVNGADGDGDGEDDGGGGPSSSRAETSVDLWSPGSQNSPKEPIRKYSGRKIRSRRSSIASAPG